MNDRLTETQMLKLVEAYRENECLWNASHTYYRNRAARDSALLKICKVLNMPLRTADISKKIKNLRSSYAQEIRKIEKSIRFGTITDSVYKPKVPWFDTLNAFLRQHVTKRCTFVSLEVHSETNTSDADDSQPMISFTPLKSETTASDIDDSPPVRRSTNSINSCTPLKAQTTTIEIDDSPPVRKSTPEKRAFTSMFNEDSTTSDSSSSVDSEHSSQTTDFVPNLGQQKKATKRTKKQKIIDGTGDFVTALQKLDNLRKEVLFQDTPKDEFDIFGKYIAESLRNMPRKLSAMAKVHMQQTLSHFELKALSTSASGNNIVQLPDSNFNFNASDQF